MEQLHSKIGRNIHHSVIMVVIVQTHAKAGLGVRNHLKLVNTTGIVMSRIRITQINENTLKRFGGLLNRYFEI